MKEILTDSSEVGWMSLQDYHSCQHVQGDRLMHVCTPAGCAVHWVWAMNLTIHRSAAG